MQEGIDVVLATRITTLQPLHSFAVSPQGSTSLQVQ